MSPLGSGTFLLGSSGAIKHSATRGSQDQVKRVVLDSLLVFVYQYIKSFFWEATLLSPKFHCFPSTKKALRDFPPL